VKYLLKPFYVIELLAVYILALLKANLVIILDILTPQDKTAPAEIEMKLASGHNDFSIYLLSCLVTMTPGTIVLNYSIKEGFFLYHELYAHSKEESIKTVRDTIEKRVVRLCS